MALLIGGHYKGSYIGSQNPGIVSLGGGLLFLNVDDFNISGPWSSRNGLRVQSDGFIYHYRSTNSDGFTLTQINPNDGVWILPRTEANGTYEFRLTNTGTASEAPNIVSDAEGTWISLTGGAINASYLQWVNQYTNSGTRSSTWTLEVRQSGGAILDSRAFVMNTTNGNL